MESSKTCTAGDTGCSLTCSVTGKPEPTITWLRSGQNLGSQKQYDFSQVKKDDKGVYTCQAKNIHGTKTKDNELVVRCKCSPLDYRSLGCSIHISAYLVALLNGIHTGGVTRLASG